MGAPGGRRLRALAVLCALVFVLWGAASAGALVAHVRELNEFGWPDENSDGEVVAWTWLYLSAAASGCWVAVWGLFGLAWRPPLHLALLALLVAVGLEVGANLVQADYLRAFDPSWSFGDQLGWYGDRVTFGSNDLLADQEAAGFFIALPLVTAVVPLLLWLVVLLTGAGRKRRALPAYGGAPAQPYAAQPYPPQPYGAQPYAAQPYPPQPYAGQPYAAQPYPAQPHPSPPQRPLPPPPPRTPDVADRPTLPYPRHDEGP